MLVSTPTVHNRPQLSRELVEAASARSALADFVIAGNVACDRESGDSTMSRMRLQRLGFWLAAALVVLAVAPTQAAQRDTKNQDSIYERSIQVLAAAGIETATASAVGIEQALVDGYATARVRIDPVFELPEEKSSVRAPAKRPAIVPIRQPPPGSDAVFVTLDINMGAVPEGVRGYRVTIEGAQKPSGPTRKPPTWLVINHFYTGGNRIGVKALIGCHAAWIWTQYATWTNMLFGQSHCPPHGSELLVPGSTTQIQVQFDGALLHQYQTWRDNSTTTWTFYPGGGL